LDLGGGASRTHTSRTEELSGAVHSLHPATSSDGLDFVALQRILELRVSESLSPKPDNIFNRTSLGKCLPQRDDA